MVARRNATKITTWCTNKRNKKKKTRLWRTKKGKKEHDLVHEETEEIHKTCVRCCMRKCPKKNGAKHTVVLLIVVVPSKIATPPKKKQFEAPFGARWIYSLSLLQSRGWRKQAKKFRTEPRKAHILNLWCVMCDTQKLLQLSWIDRLCNPKLPTCLQTAVILLW